MNSTDIQTANAASLDLEPTCARQDEAAATTRDLETSNATISALELAISEGSSQETASKQCHDVVAAIRQLKRIIAVRDDVINNLLVAYEQPQAGASSGTWGDDASVITADGVSTGDDVAGASMSDQSLAAPGFVKDNQTEAAWALAVAREQREAKNLVLDDKNNTSLKRSTGLEDTRFYYNPISRCYIPQKEQLRLLRKCERGARVALWEELRRRWPMEQAEHYLEGPCSVKFGKAELEPVFGDHNFLRNTAELSDDPPSITYAAIASCIDIRNAICHPEAHSPRTLDAMMMKAQGLAVHLGNKKQAESIRKARTELQKLVRESFAVIEKRQASPYASKRHWGLHHQRMFNDLRSFCTNLNPADCSDVVLIAASAWCAKNAYPGSECAEFRAAVLKAVYKPPYKTPRFEYCPQQ